MSWSILDRYLAHTSFLCPYAHPHLQAGPQLNPWARRVRHLSRVLAAVVPAAAVSHTIDC